MWYNLTLEYVPQRVPRGAERVFTMGLFTKLFGTRSEREVKKLEPQVEAVMALEEPYKKLTDQYSFHTERALKYLTKESEYNV